MTLRCGTGNVPNMSRDVRQAPEVIDTTKPSVARVYDCFLGGKDNYEVDRRVFLEVDAAPRPSAGSERCG